MKNVVAILVILVLAAVGAWWRHCGGVSHGDLKASIEREASATREQVAAHDARINEKLDRIEAKLDKLIEMATPKLPDGMEIVK